MDTTINNYVFYRLPEQTRYTFMAQTSGAPDMLDSAAGLTGREGFVIAPFMVSEEHPIVLMTPDVVEEHEVGPSVPLDDGGWTDMVRPDEKTRYAEDFARFHTEVAGGRFDKLVLSRCSVVEREVGLKPEQLFLRACRLYPHQFIALVSVSKVGTWLMATPEVLLDGCGNEWRTMALAGTMKRGQDQSVAHDVVWSEKNMEEQRYVSRYIESILARYGEGVSEHGPYTTVAAHLLHLRTDFTFRLRKPGCVGTLLEALHPTPAVCGMPKDAARAFIIGNESIDRKYYSGYCGPLSIQGSTHLYVSLRCMEIGRDTLHLYAGGGILGDSDMESEWRETQSKLQTMCRLLII